MDKFAIRKVDPKIDFKTAFQRIEFMSKPMASSQHRMLMLMQAACVATWPAIAAFTKYTLDQDKIEHHERLAKAAPKSDFPYLLNPNAVQYAWGTPCTLWDFECSKAYRDKINANK